MKLPIDEKRIAHAEKHGINVNYEKGYNDGYEKGFKAAKKTKKSWFSKIFQDNSKTWTID